MPHTKEGLNMLFPLHNFSSFQFNLMTGQVFFWFTFAPNGIAKAGSYGVALLFRGVLIFSDFADVLDPRVKRENERFSVACLRCPQIW